MSYCARFASATSYVTVYVLPLGQSPCGLLSVAETSSPKVSTGGTKASMTSLNWTVTVNVFPGPVSESVISTLLTSTLSTVGRTPSTFTPLASPTTLSVRTASFPTASRSVPPLACSAETSIPSVSKLVSATTHWKVKAAVPLPPV